MRQEADGNKAADENEEADWSSMAYLDLHEYLYKEMSCTPQLTLIKGTLIRKGSRKICKLMRIFPTRKEPLSPSSVRGQEMKVISTLL